MSYRKKQPRRLTLNFKTTMADDPMQSSEFNPNLGTEVPLLPLQPEAGGNVHLGFLDHILDTDTIIRSKMTSPQSGLLQAARQENVFTPLSPRPKPLLSNTFVYSSNSRPPFHFKHGSSSSVANSNLSSILLSISPTSIVDTCLTSSLSSQHVAFPANHRDCKGGAITTLSRTHSGFFPQTRNPTVKGTNILNFIKNEKHDCIAHSFPVTPSSNAAGVAPSYSRNFNRSSSALSTLTVATLPQKDYTRNTLMNHASTADTCSSPSDQMESSFSFSDPVNLNGLTPSSSFASTLSINSASDHNSKFRSNNLPTSWPIPPSSFSSSANPDGPRKPATYYPLRNILSKTAGPSILNSTNSPTSSTLAHLDLHSAPRPPPLVPNQVDQRFLTRNPSSPSTILRRDKSMVMLRSAERIKLRASQTSFESVYEDALEKTEWMETDSGDAYDDLEKTEASVRRISQSLTMMNGVGAFGRNLKRPVRQVVRSPMVQSQDSVSTASAASIPRSNYSLPTSRQPFALARSDRPSEEPQFLSRSPPAMDHHDDESNMARSRNEVDQILMGSVPLFTRMSLTRDDKEEEKPSVKSLRKDPSSRADENELKPIAEDTGKSSLPSSSSNPRRRLKPLILRPSTPIVTPTRKRASTPSSKILSIGSSIDNTSSLDSSSPPHPAAQPDVSRESNESMPTLSSGESPSFRRYPQLRSDKKVPPNEATVNDTHQRTLSSSIASSLTSSADSSAEIILVPTSTTRADLKSSNPSEISKKTDKINNDNREILLESVIAPSKQSTDYVPLEDKLATVSFRNNTSLNSYISERHQGNRLAGLTQHQSASSINLPTLAAGSSKLAWAQSATTKTQLRSSSRKRHINLFMPRQQLIDMREGSQKSSGLPASPFSKGSLDSTLAKELPTLQHSLKISHKGEDFVNDASSSIGSKGKPRLWGSNRLTVTLTRMEAQEGKLIDLSTINKTNPRAFVKGKEAKKLVKGKLKRISQPVLLSGEEERLALWGMISNGKHPGQQLR